MILDTTAIFSSAQTITNGNATNVIDLGAPGTVLGASTALSRDVGPGEPLPFMAQVITAFAGAGTLTINIVTCDTISLSGAVTLASTAALTATTLVAGYQAALSIIPNQAVSRYLGVTYTVSTTSLTGVLSAAIVAGLQTNKAAGRS